MHQGGWLHEIVLASCWHTNQHWCRLSALILVNTNVYVRKGSDRCMIEVLKSRHSQRLSSSPLISQSCCDSPHAFLHQHYMHQLSFICRHVHPTPPPPTPSWLINVAHLLQALILNARQCGLNIANRGRVPCFSFIKWKLSIFRDLGRTCLIPSDFAFFSKTLHYK